MRRFSRLGYLCMCFVCPSVPLFRTSKRPAGSTDTEGAVKAARTSSICFNEWFFLVLWISEIFILFWENIVGCRTQEPTKAVVPRPDSSLSGWQGYCPALFSQTHTFLTHYCKIPSKSQPCNLLLCGRTVSEAPSSSVKPPEPDQPPRIGTSVSFW